eukprot:CAMPEP_0185749012 /NCGR_PEP_ID=MMETSP1174-20130828/7755_1 /TAXON_ID=35687 /ORGANISM="Dictyocha speculum, Strain CCMP1381" /LENGTH=584 /DNA_ID=CAMNT_0028424957 /DNA_START=79 /DNA_END=1833 /DNA_ORIENTATION=-
MSMDLDNEFCYNGVSVFGERFTEDLLPPTVMSGTGDNGQNPVPHYFSSVDLQRSTTPTALTSMINNGQPTEFFIPSYNDSSSMSLNKQERQEPNGLSNGLPSNSQNSQQQPSAVMPGHDYLHTLSTFGSSQPNAGSSNFLDHPGSLPPPLAGEAGGEGRKLETESGPIVDTKVCSQQQSGEMNRRQTHPEQASPGTSYAPTSTSEPMGGFKNVSPRPVQGPSLSNSADPSKRDRNREHARNTRLRKKAYIEKLKQTVQVLSKECETITRDNQQDEVNETEILEQRHQVIQRMMNYRTSGVVNPEKWQAVLAQDFTMTLPITPHRFFNPNEVVGCRRVVRGVSGMIQDTASFKVLISSIGRRKYRGHGEVEVNFNMPDGETVIKNDLFMTRWTMSTTNAMSKGALAECSLEGMLKATFADENTISSVDLIFDVMSFMQQLPEACGGPFEVVPNSMFMLSQPSKEARVICSANAPFNIEQANQPWLDICGFTEAEARGKTFKIIQGDETDFVKVADLMRSVQAKLPHSMLTVNYKKSGQPFLNFVRVFPICTGSEVTHFLSVIEEQQHKQQHTDATIRIEEESPGS